MPSHQKAYELLCSSEGWINRIKKSEMKSTENLMEEPELKKKNHIEYYSKWSPSTMKQYLKCYIINAISKLVLVEYVSTMCL